MGTGSRLTLRPIVDGHLDTFRDRETRKIAPRDWVEQFVIPCVASIVAAGLCLQITGTAAAAIMTLAGLFAAFFFQLGVQLLDRAADWAENSQQTGADTSEYASLLEHLSANTNYAALVGGATAVAALVVGLTDSGLPERLFAALTVGLLVHLGATLLLVVSRVFLLTRARLNSARTGKDRHV